MPQLNKVASGNTKRFFDSIGFGWLFESQQEIEEITLTDLNVIPLKGNFDFGYALGQYSEPIKTHAEKTQVGNLLYRLKYQFEQDAGVLLADLAVELINSRNFLKSCDLVVTVPPSFTSRPFDPVSFLAQKISKITGIGWGKDVIKRARIAKLQKRIFDKSGKEENVISTFRLNNPLLVIGKKILLLDDLYDSRVTIKRISQLLRQAKANKIFVLVMAKTNYV